jgi:hypothetical protein
MQPWPALSPTESASSGAQKGLRQERYLEHTLPLAPQPASLENASDNRGGRIMLS